MEFIYAVFMVVGQGWSFVPGYYPLQVEDCNSKVVAMQPLIEEVYHSSDKITDYELGCITADSYEHLREILMKRYPPGRPS